MAVNRLYALKNRENKPGTIIAANSKQLLELGADASSVEQCNKFWGNPVSVVLNLEKLEYLHLGVLGVACRVVGGPQRLIELLEQTGPLLTSSANHPGEPQAENIAQAQIYFGNNVDFYVDAGEAPNKQPSTVIKLDGNQIVVLREGAYKVKRSRRATNSYGCDSIRSTQSSAASAKAVL